MSYAPLDLFQAATAVLNYSYSPYSHYRVACALRAQDGSIYAGCNVENASYSATLCAESSALGALISGGHRLITEALILVDDQHIASPCGPCRQRLVEFSEPAMIVHMSTVSGLYHCERIDALLPLAFSLHGCGVNAS